MQTRKTPSPPPRGFALVVSLSLMVLLTIVAVGLLTLSAISLRSSGRDEAGARARFNARLAVILALGELQKHAGDDRRITADASMLGVKGRERLVGVWNSWSPSMGRNPVQGSPDYEEAKQSSFRSWLASSPDPVAANSREWANVPVDAKAPRLFAAGQDGFELKAAGVPVPLGTMAWAVTQENTKAKINVDGPEEPADANVALHSQPRPSLALSETLRQPEKGWNLRAVKLASISQAALDTTLVADPAKLPAAAASHTVHARGLLTDAVNGGLKTDLSLGFELEDAEFANAKLDEVPNPFQSPAGGPASPSSYRSQRALFMPVVENPIVPIETNYSPASVAHRFYAAGVPTFDHLRSFYRIPHHLYGGESPVVGERSPDHVAINIPAAAAGSYFAPNRPPKGLGSTLAIRPVLNRMVYLLSASLSADNQVELALTPVVSLWNPYNTALEIEGAVAYPWIDLPFQLEWQFRMANGTVGRKEVNMSMMMGRQFENKAHGRSVDPYFFCEITGDGGGSTAKPIRFEPGEVRIFTPVSAEPVKFVRTGTGPQRTVRMRPVDDISQMNTRGGLAVPMKDGVRTNGAPHGFTYVVKQTDKVSIRVRPSSYSGQYHYFVSLEDSTRIRDKSPQARGEAISDVQILSFASAVAEINSPQWTFTELKNTPQPFAVIETFHRTALQSVGAQPIADLIYTTNPRHGSINHQLAAGSFTVAPHFQSTLRGVSSFDGAIQTSFDGRRSFWGPSHSASGKTHLPFFEIPREPLLSLAGFQHADFSSSTFSPAHQFANSWASPYLGRDRVAMIDTKHTKSGVPVYDTAYLSNEALWDGFFLSGAGPVLSPGGNSKPSSAWESPTARVVKPVSEVLKEFVKSPSENPLAHGRMQLHQGPYTEKELLDRLLGPAGCARIAAHLTVDGAFNINSTDVEAWTAMLCALRGQPFEVEGGKPAASDTTAAPRFRRPTGKPNDNWNGFRTLDDGQVRKLASNLVDEIRKRGPFLSLAEFVNRRVENSDLGRAGALQAAIDATGLNDQAKQAAFSADRYPAEARDHIIKDTGVGIPGYLTQADVLQPLAPVITCRSDTFTVRGYGESRDASGKVLARAWCEVVAQRVPEFIDPSNTPETPLAEAAAGNKTFGRRFDIISFRWLPSAGLL